MSMDTFIRIDPTFESVRLNRHVAPGAPLDVSRRETTRARTLLGIVGIAAVAVATLGAVTDDDETTTGTVGVVMETGRSQDRLVVDPRVTPSIATTGAPTQLDVRGVPTWWTAAGAATGPGAGADAGDRLTAAGSDPAGELTELDERGIPTWWTGT